MTEQVDVAVVGPGQDADYRALPRVTCTDPEIGAAGLTEREARDQGIGYVPEWSPSSSNT